MVCPYYTSHQNFLFWNFHQNHSPKKFPFLETISKFGKTFPKRKFPFLEFYQKSPSQNISFFGNHFQIWKSHDCHQFPKKEFPFLEKMFLQIKKIFIKKFPFLESHMTCLHNHLPPQAYLISYLI